MHSVSGPKISGSTHRNPPFFPLKLKQKFLCSFLYMQKFCPTPSLPRDSFRALQ